MTVSFIVEGNWSTWRKPPTCHKSEIYKCMEVVKVWRYQRGNQML